MLYRGTSRIPRVCGHGLVKHPGAQGKEDILVPAINVDRCRSVVPRVIERLPPWPTLLACWVRNHKCLGDPLCVTHTLSISGFKRPLTLSHNATRPPTCILACLARVPKLCERRGMSSIASLMRL